MARPNFIMMMMSSTSKAFGSIIFPIENKCCDERQMAWVSARQLVESCWWWRPRTKTGRVQIGVSDRRLLLILETRYWLASCDASTVSNYTHTHTHTHGEGRRRSRDKSVDSRQSTGSRGMSQEKGTCVARKLLVRCFSTDRKQRRQGGYYLWQIGHSVLFVLVTPFWRFVCQPCGRESRTSTPNDLP